MRISDWSSDVCSSDLLGHIGDVERRLLEAHEIGQDLHPVKQGIDIPMDVPFGGALRASPDHRRPCQIALADIEARSDADPAEIGEAPGLHGDVREPRRLPESHRNPDRSEEHTSELQSLMRNSYAVFCLKKKNIK